MRTNYRRSDYYFHRSQPREIKDLPFVEVTPRRRPRLLLCVWLFLFTVMIGALYA